jgi:hypothetical protein
MEDGGSCYSSTNGSGSITPTVVSRMISPLPLTNTHGISAGQYSRSNWRHAPQLMPPSLVAHAKREKWRSPSDNALNRATRSAQTVSPYESLSTLTPVKIFPLDVCNAAPTLYLECLQHELSIALIAIAVVCSVSDILWCRVRGRHDKRVRGGVSYLHSLIPIQNSA